MNKILIPFTVAVLIFVSLFSIQAATAQTNQVVPSQQLVPITFNLPGGDVSGTADPNSINVSFNPKEYFITKSLPWNHNMDTDAPALEFTTGQPARVTMELFFDTFEEKTSVATEIDKIQDLVLVNPETRRPPICLLSWGSFQFSCVLESMSVKYTLFSSDGTPLRATVDVVFSKLLPADEKLNSYTLTGRDLMRLLDASSTSFSLLDSYGTDSLQRVVDKLFENLQVDKTNSILFSSTGINPVPGGQSSFAFNVDISGNTNQEHNSWNGVIGGQFIIEQTDTTVGADQFQTHALGHKSFADIELKGPLKKSRAELLAWLKNPSGFECKNCKQVVLSFYDNGQLLAQSKYSVIDAFYFKNEVFLLSVQDNKLHATILNIERTLSDGTQFNGPPRILVVLPTANPMFMPVGIGGTNFDQGGIPYFGTVPSGQLFNFGLNNLPLIGSVSVGFTIVPPSAPSGPADVTISEFGQTSNLFPFTIN